MIRISPPLDETFLEKLKAGEDVLISGKVYTARDAAHKRFVELINKGEKLPVDLKGQIIYYVGPTPAKPGLVVGSAGPTTSSRMDSTTQPLLKLGLKATIGKGGRSKEVVECFKKYKAVHLATAGGAGAYLSKRIKNVKVVAWEDLGPEAVYEMVFEDFPAIVINDIFGNDYYEMVSKSGISI